MEDKINYTPVFLSYIEMLYEQRKIWFNHIFSYALKDRPQRQQKMDFDILVIMGPVWKIKDHFSFLNLGS